MSLSWVLFTKSGGDKLARNAIGGITGQKPTEENKTQTPNEQAVSSGLENLETECRKGVNVEKPECVKWFNELTKNGASVSTGDNRQTTVLYNPNQPYDNEIQKQVSYEVTAKPVFSGCMKQVLNIKLIRNKEQNLTFHKPTVKSSFRTMTDRSTILFNTKTNRANGVLANNRKKTLQLLPSDYKLQLGNKRD